jgi:hypothetical protein
MNIAEDELEHHIRDEWLYKNEDGVETQLDEDLEDRVLSGLDDGIVVDKIHDYIYRDSGLPSSTYTERNTNVAEKDSGLLSVDDVLNFHNERQTGFSTEHIEDWYEVVKGTLADAGKDVALKKVGYVPSADQEIKMMK